MKWTQETVLRHTAEIGGHRYVVEKTAKGHTLSVYKGNGLVLVFNNRSISRLKNMALEHYLRNKPQVKECTAAYWMGRMAACAGSGKKKRFHWE